MSPRGSSIIRGSLIGSICDIVPAEIWPTVLGRWSIRVLCLKQNLMHCCIFVCLRQKSKFRPLRLPRTFLTVDDEQGTSANTLATTYLSMSGNMEPDDLLSRAMDAFNIPESRLEGVGPASLPPAMAAMRGKSTEEMLADLNKSPLFMTDLEENNDDLEALKALAYEGTPAEVGMGFKERGNECFKEGKWADAKEFYGKGIQVLQAEVRKRAAAEKKTGVYKRYDVEIMDELVTLEASLVNRAACHLSLRNYRSCTLDCVAAIRLNPKNIKAYYRCSKALLAINKITEADDVCATGLALDPSNAALKVVADQIIAKHAQIQAKKQKEIEIQQTKLKEAMLLRTSLKAREIKIRKTAQPPEMEDARIQLLPDPGDPTSSLVFPTVLLYPLNLQSDFIKEFHETETIGARLGHILAEPAPWDTKREYTLKSVECYMETITGGLIKLGKNVTLLRALSGGKVEVVDEVVRIFVVPKSKSEAWVADFKIKKAKEKKSG
jgi:tetratricopeptide (TPR) repeat protein